MDKKLELKDTYRHKGLRRQLVNSIREKGIKDENVLKAMQNVPRHFFMDSALDRIAYEDRAFPIAAGQTISQPYTVAYQTELLQIKVGDKVLEIGTGSTYQATVLAEMDAQVFTIERQTELFRKNQHYPFKELYHNIEFKLGDGFAGWPDEAPFDKILVTAAAPYVPTALLQQLRPGGLLVIPVDEGDTQRMMRLTKQTDGTTIEEYFDQFSFVPMLGNVQQHK